MQWQSWQAKAYPVMLFLAALLLYTLTLLPGLGQADTAEFQRVLPTRTLSHPTGYPLYAILGWIWTKLPLGTSIAWRANMLSAVFGALTTIVIYQSGRVMRLSQLVSTVAALSFATSLAFWVQATRTEVYALAVLLQMGFVLALLLWRAERLPLWVVGLVFGLGLAHHRMIALLAPGALLMVLLHRRPRLRELALALLASLAPTLLYLHILTQLPPWADRWGVFFQYLFAEDSKLWLRPDRLLEEGVARPLLLFREYIWGQFLLVGVPLQLLGALRLIRRDRGLAALLLVSELILFLFCSAYYVSDIDVFLIPIYALGVLLLAQGLAFVLELLPERAARLAAPLGLLLPLALLVSNWGALRVINTNADEVFARAIMAHRFPERALVIGDWNRIESLRYLQVVEGQHPTIELLLTFDAESLRPNIEQAFAAGRAVYLLEPTPGLGLHQLAEGPVWRLENRPLEIAPTTPSDLRWANGIQLRKYTLPEGPYLPGQSVPIALEWHAERAPGQSYTLFIHLLDAEGRLWGQQDRVPSNTTDTWQPGTPQRELYAPLLSPETPPGRYQVRLGWYLYPSMERLALGQPDGGAQDYAVLGEVEVRPAGGR